MQALLLAFALLQLPATRVQPASAPLEPRVEIWTRSGERTTRSARELELTRLEALEAAWVRVEGARAPAFPADAEIAEVALVGGDRLAGRLKGGEGDELALELVGGSIVRLSLERLVELRVAGRVPVVWTSPLEAPESGDRVYRKQGEGLDRIDGTVQELRPEGVVFHSVLGSRTLPWDEIAALFVEPLADAPPAAREGGIVCDLVDGGRLRGLLVRLSEAGVELELDKGDVLFLPLGALAGLAPDDGSVAFLSALEPRSADGGAPFGDELGMLWPPRPDRAVVGGALRAAGRSYARGLGVHAPSRVVFALDGPWSALLGSVAIDDGVLRLPRRGSARFRIEVDGEERWRSGLLSGGDAPVALPQIALEGAHELALVVEAGEDGFVADRADWLGMVLVRQRAERASSSSAR